MRDRGLTPSAIEAVWRVEAARLIGGLVRFVRDVDHAEDLAQDALIAVLRNHPRYALAAAPDALDENLRLLQVWDYLSLLLCMGPVHEQVLEDVPLGAGRRVTLRIAGDGSRGMALDPFPLAAPLIVWIDARPVTGAPFASDSALQAALDGVPYKPLVFEIVPL